MLVFVQDSYVQIITILIMVLGSLGIIVIEDLKDKKFKFNKIKLQTKIVIIFTVIFLVVPTIMVKIYDSELTANKILEDTYGIEND